MSRHIASYGHKGWTGKRIGTRFIYTHEEAQAAQLEPWFRWKNDETRRAHIEWAAALARAQETSPALAQKDQDNGQ